MTRAIVAFSWVAICVLSGCENRSPGTTHNQIAKGSAEPGKARKLTPADLPPPIVRSPSYRCDDGKALYVDVLRDKLAVLVRDSRSDVPTRLERQSDGGPLTGSGRSLSGTGKDVQYSSQARPSQMCHQGSS